MRLPEPIDTPLRTAFGLLVLPAALILYSAAVMLLVLRGAQPERIHSLYVRYARLCTRFAGTKLEIHGLANIEPSQPYVVVLNHESALDPVYITLALSDLVVRFVAKAQTMAIPVLGHALRRTGNVSVVRTDTAYDVKELQRAMARRHPRVSFLFCAEGTRSRDGALHAFKMGAFATALDYHLPILPCAIAGNYAIWPKGTVRLRRGIVVIEVGAPIPIEGLTPGDRAALRDRTHEAVAKLRASARARLRARGVEPGGID